MFIFYIGEKNTIIFLLQGFGASSATPGRSFFFKQSKADEVIEKEWPYFSPNKTHENIKENNALEKFPKYVLLLTKYDKMSNSSAAADPLYPCLVCYG